MDRYDWWLGALMGWIHFSFHVLMRLIPALIPVLAIGLGYPLWKLGVLVSVSLVGSSIGLLPMGVASDRYDRRVTLSGALGVAGFGFVVFALAPALGAGVPTQAVGEYTLDGTFLVMSLAMLIAGLGMSAHVPVGIPLLTKNASQGTRGTILGIWGAGSKFGDAAAPALVGILILGFGWEPILLVFGVLGLASGIGLYLVLDASEFDTRPGASSSAADEGGTDPLWADRRRYLYPILALFGYFAAYSIVVQGTVAFTPAFIADVYSYSVRLGGVRFGPESFADFALSLLLVSAGVSRLLGGVLVDRYEKRAVLLTTLILAAGALFAFSRLSLGPVAVVVVLSVFGVGIWGNSPARDSLISDITPAAREGRTFSYLFTASRVFGALSPAVIGFMAETAGLRLGFTYLAVATLAAAFFVALLFSERVYMDGSGLGEPLAGDD